MSKKFKIYLMTLVLLIIGLTSNSQGLDSTQPRYKVGAFETFIKGDNPTKTVKVDNGKCNLIMSFNIKCKEIVVTNDQGIVLSFYTIMGGETK